MNNEVEQNEADQRTEEQRSIDAYNEALKRKYAAREADTSTTPPPADDTQNEED